MFLLDWSQAQLLELVWFMAVFSILALSLNLIVGQAGLFQLGHIGFFALGSLGSVLATHPAHAGLDLVSGILLGAAFAAVAALAIGLPTLRLRGDYFAIVTLGFGIGVQVVLQVFFVQGVFNVPPLNPFGVPLSPTTRVLGLELDASTVEVVVALGAALLTYLALQRLARAPFGRTLRAVREDGVAARALGKNAGAFRLKAFVLSAVLAALAGSLYVHHLRVFDPSFYGFDLMILILVMIILGGLGSHQGAILGTVLVTLLREAVKDGTHELDIPYDVPALNIMLFSALLIVLMILRPQGLLGDRDFPLRRLLAGALGRTPPTSGGGPP